MRQPDFEIKRVTSASNAEPLAPAHFGSEVPNTEPRSPMPAADRIASQTA